MSVCKSDGEYVTKAPMQSLHFHSGVQFCASFGSTERPTGSPGCSIHAVNGNSALRYRCQWPGGTPEAQLSFPTLNTSSTGLGELSVTMDDLEGLDGKEVACLINHPIYQGQCNITARKLSNLLSLPYSGFKNCSYFCHNGLKHNQGYQFQFLFLLEVSVILAFSFLYIKAGLQVSFHLCQPL